MYSKIKNIQIIVSLLKQHNIRHIVLSAGTRHVPIAHSVENDPFFSCYSVVDERSAGYYAIGIARETGEKVAIACTSSTATCNYTPAVAEAYYQNIPLLILTGDRDPYCLDQLEDQMIDQVDMYRNFCRKCVDLPVVSNAHDEWYCARLVNEAILELDHHGGGPVQINFPIVQSIEDIADASAEKLPECIKISRVDALSRDSEWERCAAGLRAAGRIMVLCGSAIPADDGTVAAMKAFADRFNCAFVVEKVSNLRFEGAVDAYLVAEALTESMISSVIKPDLVIFFGGNFISRWKTHLRGYGRRCRSWVISPAGTIIDPFRNLSEVFECTPEYFFRRCAELAPDGSNDRVLLGELQTLKDSIAIPPMDEMIRIANKYDLSGTVIPEGAVTAFSAIYGLSRKIPEHSVLHLGILNATRIMEMFELPADIEVHSNIGTDGIDGSVSTFLGQAVTAQRECFLVVGDLSFFYDMNSVSIRGIGKNVHILLINNGGGAEFYYSMGPARLPNIDRHISAAHNHRAEEWVRANGFTYMTASDLQQFDSQIDRFVETEGPVLFEVFTDKQRDVDLLKSYQKHIRIDTPGRSFMKSVAELPGVKQALNSNAGEKLKNIVKKITK